MQTQLVVDAACELPEVFYTERGIKILPIRISIDGELLLDERKRSVLLETYQKDRFSLEHDVETQPLNAAELEQFFLNSIAPNCDYALVQTTSKERSAIFENCEAAQNPVLKWTRDARENGERESVFGLRIMNSGTMFTGQALLAAFTTDLLQSGKTTKDVLKMTDAFRKRIFAYALPADTGYIRERSKKKGENSIGLFAAVIAKSLDVKPIIQFYQDGTQVVQKKRGMANAANELFEYAARRIDQGLLAPYVIVSYGGNPDELKQFEAYNALEQKAKQANVSLLTSVMGMAGAVSLGPGSISLALSAEEHDFDV
jgi:DegV family protein with EDD domain